MKTVFDARMVAHIWANKGQDEARTPSGNLYFTGPTLYSYGTHYVIAHHIDTPAGPRILWNDEGYGNTTNKHTGYAAVALSQRQMREQLIHVPELNENHVREIDRCMRDRDGRVPKLIDACAKKVVALVRSMAGRRYSATLCNIYADAVTYSKSGKLIAELVSGKGRKRVRWPVADLPDELPRDGAARDALITMIAKQSVLAEVSKLVADVRRTYSELSERIADTGYVYGDGDLLRRHRDACLILSNAGNMHASVMGGARSREMGKLSRELGALRSALQAKHARFEIEQAHYTIRETIKDARRTMLVARRNRMPWAPTSNMIANVYNGKLDAALMALSNAALADQPEYLDWVKRIQRKTRHGDMLATLSNIKDKMRTADSFLPRHVGDALGHYKTAQRWAQGVVSQMIREWGYPGNHPDLFEAGRLEAKCFAEIADLDARVTEENKQRAAEWIAGGPRLPAREYGTLARIEGEIVRTTLGATVPLEHACRLARIARRVIKAGGRTWADNDGPMVGHFRVTSIAADGATVIGCHQFAAAEVHRMLALLESCDTCRALDAGEVAANSEHGTV